MSGSEFFEGFHEQRKLFGDLPTFYIPLFWFLSYSPNLKAHHTLFFYSVSIGIFLANHKFWHNLRLSRTKFCSNSALVKRSPMVIIPCLVFMVAL